MLWNLPRNYKQTITQQISDNKSDLTENLGTGCHGQLYRDAKKRQKQRRHKEVFPLLEKSLINRRISTLQKAICSISKTYLWFIIPISKVFFDLKLMYVSQGSIYLAVAFSTGGIDAAAMTPSEEQTLFSSSSIQKEILGVWGVFGAQLAWKGYLSLWLDFHVGKPEKIIHLRIAVAWRVSLGGILSKAEAVSIN